MAATNAHKVAVANAIAAMGAKITPHSADPGTTGASRIGALEGNTTWGAAAIGSGGDADKAVSTGSAVPFSIPASTNVTHFGVWSGTTFLRGYPLEASITVNANGPASVDITPKIKYTA